MADERVVIRAFIDISDDEVGVEVTQVIFDLISEGEGCTFADFEFRVQ